MSDPAKMDLKSKSITEEQKAKLRELFPEVFAEDKIDFDKLKLTLGEDVDDGIERYGMQWHGKRDCFKVIQQPSTGTLKPCKEESISFDDTQNLFIEGDNLEVLKLLQKSYYGKVKMIYIDPPYNTGKEFIYPDNYKEDLDTYLSYTGQIDEAGKKFSTNSETEGRFHSKWMNMMYPRLFLAKNLLTPDGVIFISIDDCEVSNLRAMCDELFGEENFMGNVARATGQTTGQDSGGLGSSFDFILVYAKDAEVDLSGLPLTDKDKKRFENKDERGFYAFDQMRKTGSNDRREDRPNMFYPVYAPDGTAVLPLAPAGYEGRWRFEKKTYEKYLEDGYILWKKTNRNGDEIWWPYVKYYLEGRTKRPSPLWNDLDGNKKAARDLRELFDGKKVFDFPKPSAVIERCIQISPNSDENDIVLDFFAGAGVLGESVLKMNATQGGNRKFIMVQLPEPCEETTEASKAGFKNIADIGKERIRKVIQKIEAEQESTGDDLLRMAEEKAKLDLGFRVFKLDRSNFNLWDGEVGQTPTEEKLTKQLELGVDHINSNSTPEDILYELLLKSGFELTTKVEAVEMAEKTVYSIENDALLICLEDNLTKEVITEMARRQPARVVCLDQGFAGNDQLKTNAVQIMKSHEVEDFRTV